MEVLKAFVGVIMIVCFLVQMWELFGQFNSELKTVAVSFKEENMIEFPSFAFYLRRSRSISRFSPSSSSAIHDFLCLLS